MTTIEKIHWDEHIRQIVIENLKIAQYQNPTHDCSHLATIEMSYDDTCFIEIFQQQRKLFDNHDIGDLDQDLYKCVPASAYKQQLTTGEYILHGVFIRSIERYPDENRYIAQLSIDFVEVL